MLLLIDNNIKKNKYSYIYKLQNALNDLKIPFYEVNSINVNEIENLKLKIKGIILSGSKIKLTKKTLFKEYIHNIYYILNLPNIPILGICFGSQILHLLYGGKLRDRKKYLCKVQDVELDNNNLLFKNNKEFTKMQFCFSDLILPFNNENKNIKEIGWFKLNNKKIPCAYEYKTNKIFGLLFHPEILESSWPIIFNFAKLCGII